MLELAPLIGGDASGGLPLVVGGVEVPGVDVVVNNGAIPLRLRSGKELWREDRDERREKRRTRGLNSSGWSRAMPAASKRLDLRN